MTATPRGYLRDNVIRREIRDEDAAVFTDAELNTYLNNAILSLSEYLPREVTGTLDLVAGQADYDAPDDLIEVVSITAGATEYHVATVFGGVMTLSPTPSSAGTADLKYRAIHGLLSDDDEVGTYDLRDEPLIVTHVKAQCCQTLAIDGAKYYEYQEGDIRESQGRTQAQFRAEADRLYAEFAEGARLAAQTRQATRPAPSRTMAGVVRRKARAASATIYKA